MSRVYIEKIVGSMVKIAAKFCGNLETKGQQILSDRYKNN